MTTLHAGGKFGGKATRCPAVFTASAISSSTRCPLAVILEVDREGQHWLAMFEKAGRSSRRSLTLARPQGPIHGRARHGTTVTFWPDAAVFDETEFPRADDHRAAADMAFLNKGLEIPLHR